jgi:hypothetical protein
VQGIGLGAIASSLSSTSGSFGEALERISSSTSLRYSPLSRSSFQRAYVAFAANSDLCLSFLRNCDDYGEKVFTWCLSFNASPMSSRVGAPHDLRERTARLLSEATSISTEDVASVKGLSSYESTPMTPVTDRGGNFCSLLTRVATVQNHVQEGLGCRTEDYVRVKHSARESLVLGGSHRLSFQRCAHRRSPPRAPRTRGIKMCLGKKKRLSAFGPGNSDERTGASSSLLTGFHALSICIKAMDDESCLFFVMHSLLFFVHCWVYNVNSSFYWMFSVSSC